MQRKYNNQAGTYDINGREYYFHSKMEANYALYLDFLKKQKEILNWEYEPDRFVFEKILTGTRVYTPDFKVWITPAKWEYHETKGYMDAQSKTKLKRMRIYYPKEIVIVIDAEAYKSLKKWKNLLKFY